MWVNDAEGVLVLDNSSLMKWSLHGIDAALWDWISLSYSFKTVVEMTAVFLRIPKEIAEQKVKETISRWLAMGIMQDEGGNS